MSDREKEGERAPRKGDSFYLYREVDLYRPIYFAGASGVFSPLYIDPIFGKMLGLGGNILHEICIFSFVLSSIEEWIGRRFAVESMEVNFIGFVNPGEVIKIFGKVMKVERRKKKLVIKIEVGLRDRTIAKGKAVIKI